MSRRIFLLVLVTILFSGLLRGQVELLGEITPDEILLSLPDWKAIVESYSPNLEIMSRLQAVNEEIQIEIFLGTWCSDSKQHVSAYIKVMDMVQNPLFKTIYIGIPRDKDSRTKYVQGKDIQKIPTFIVTIRGQEAGRIIETPQTSVEEDLWKIIQGKL
jgi:hypothetical protein